MKYLLYLFLGVFIFGCKSKKVIPSDTSSFGTIQISVDESFKPAIEEQIEMYKNSYPETNIIASYKTEADCFKDLISDTSCRMIIITRGLSNKEEKFFKDTLGYTPKWNIIAKDAIAIIVNSKSNDTLFTLEKLKSLLNGSEKDKLIVFDGLNATSSFRFITDSILKGGTIDSNYVRAAKNNLGVIDYVSENVNAIGIIGISWIGNPEDSSQLKMLTKVKIAAVKCSYCPNEQYVKPFQINIQNNSYPLVRGLYYIAKENYSGLASGFSSFLKNERGQLIFRRAYLAPVMDFDVRNVKINID
ncbi:MAG: substrate-binding domain-containing protein [Ferruginibacter sp.]